jgi:hypothetical protein
VVQGMMEIKIKARNESTSVAITLGQGDFIDPDAFNTLTTVPSDHLSKIGNFELDPICSYTIESMHVTQPSKILRIENKLYNKYLSATSVFRNLDEK